MRKYNLIKNNEQIILVFLVLFYVNLIFGNKALLKTNFVFNAKSSVITSTSEIKLTNPNINNINESGTFITFNNVLLCKVFYNKLDDSFSKSIHTVVKLLTVISSQPLVSQTVCQNSAPTSLSVTASGTGTLTYTWYSNTTNLNSGGSVISGATNSSYSPPTYSSGTKYYYCIVSSLTGAIASNTATVNVNTQTIISGQPLTTQTVCQNSAPTSLSITAIGTGTLTYQWYSNVTNSIFGATAITGATNFYFLPPTVTTGTKFYYCTVTGYCGVAVSSISAVVVNAVTTITSQSMQTQSNCLGKIPTPLSIVATGNILTYQWYNVISASTTGGTLISGATNSSYLPSTTTTGTFYYYCVVNGACGTATSQLFTFIVGGSSTWNGLTWDNAPSINSNLYINGNYNSTNSIQGCSCNVLSGNVIINSGHTITLQNELNVNNGTFTINNNANLIQINQVLNSGIISLKRDTNPLMRLDYTLWSSPVLSQNLLSFSPNTITSRFYSYNTPTDTYQSVIPLTTYFGIANGYLIRTPNNFPTIPTIWTGTFTGVPNNGTISYPLEISGNKYNAIGNPYPSPLYLVKFVDDNSNNITGTLYFWRETNNNSLNIPYCTWSGGTFVTNADNGYGSIGVGGTDPNNVITQGQGFIVQGSATGTEVVFNNEQRVDMHTNHFFKQSETIDEFNRVWLNISNSSGAFYQMAFGYNSNATDGIDFNDGRSMELGSIALNSYLNATDLVILGKSLPFNDNDSIPLSYNVTEAGNYTITIDHKDGLFADGTQQVYIKDNLYGTYNLLTTNGYTFVSSAGYFNDRFEIVFKIPNLVNNQNHYAPSSIIFYKTSEKIIVNTGQNIMKSVKVFDTVGRLLFENNSVNKSETSFSIDTIKSVICIQIISLDDSISIKKFIDF